MKKLYTIAAAAAICLAANAQTEVMKIELTDGNVQTIKIESIKEITFATETETMAGTYNGTVTLNVGGMYDYPTTVAVTIVQNTDGTLNFTWPEYKLEGTMMGNLTLGTYTISNIAYDESKGGYYRDYSNDGLQQHFTAIAEGAAQPTFDKDYDLGATSTILIEKTDTGIKVTNPFKLGAMPLSISASFEGSK